jgi:molybdenum cofactor cytidylyltransferase
VTEVDVVILAAGFSSRAGTFKPALDIAGKPLLARCVETFHDLCASVIVVAGHEADRVAALVSPYPKVQLVQNAAYATGMFSSVRAGAAAVRSPRFFLIPGDHPLVSPRTCALLLDTKGNVVVPSFSGKAGHPVLLDAEILTEILAEAPESNLRAVLSRHERTFVTVDDPGVLFDVDTMDDYREAVAAFAARD